MLQSFDKQLDIRRLVQNQLDFEAYIKASLTPTQLIMLQHQSRRTV